jgi:hemerythrin-like domain-containing protein
MEPIESLMNEHRLIELVLDALETYVKRLGPDGSADPEDLSRFVEFIRAFADRWHHGKEEDILFEAMVKAGIPREVGPIAVMLHEHDQGRALVGLLHEASQRAPGWPERDLWEVRQAAQGYAGLLRQHIQKEDQILYPMALSRLDSGAVEEIGRLFERFETEGVEAGEHRRLLALADELITRYREGSASK